MSKTGVLLFVAAAAVMVVVLEVLWEVVVVVWSPLLHKGPMVMYTLRLCQAAHLWTSGALSWGLVSQLRDTVASAAQTKGHPLLLPSVQQAVGMGQYGRLVVDMWNHTLLCHACWAMMQSHGTGYFVSKACVKEEPYVAVMAGGDALHLLQTNGLPSVCSMWACAVAMLLPTEPITYEG